MMLLWERKKFVEKGIDNHHLLVTIFVYTRVIYNTRTKYIVLCAGSDWSCRFCGLPVSVSMVSATISSLESELSAVLEADYSVATLQAFMASHSHQLHSKHYLNILGRGSFFCTSQFHIVVPFQPRSTC